MVLGHADWLRTGHRCEASRHAWCAFFEEWDILVCPQMAAAEFPYDHSPMHGRTLAVNGQSQPYCQQLLWSGIVAAPCLPSTALPAGLGSDGLPIGLQAGGAAYRTRLAFYFTRLPAQEIGGFQAPPGY